MNTLGIKDLEAKIRWLYPIWIVVSIFSIAYVPTLIFEKGDVLKTAANLAENEMLFRLSIIGSITTAILMVYVSFYLYLLFESINASTAKLMLIFALLSIPFMGFDLFKILAVGTDDADVVYNYLSIQRTAQTVAEVFWGLWLFPLGMLVLESKYFPKILGYALIAGCFGYLFGVVIKVVFPQASDLLVIADVLAFGELVFALWFVFRGIKIPDATS